MYVRTTHAKASACVRKKNSKNFFFQKNFFSKKIIFSKKFFFCKNIFLHLSGDIFGLKKFLTKKIFGLRKIFDEKFFGHCIFSQLSGDTCQGSFLDLENFWRKKKFLDLKNFWRKNFLDLVFFTPVGGHFWT